MPQLQIRDLSPGDRFTSEGCTFELLPYEPVDFRGELYTRALYLLIDGRLPAATTTGLFPLWSLVQRAA